MSTKLLNRRQARWSEFLSRFNFKIVHRPGKQSTKPDALTRRPQDLPKPGDPRLEHQSQTVLKRENLVLAASEAHTHTPIDDLWNQEYSKDLVPRKVLQALRENRRKSRHLQLDQCSDNNGRLRYQGRIYVPDFMPLKLHLIREYYDTPAAGHLGRAKTLELLTRTYFWPGMRKNVD